MCRECNIGFIGPGPEAISLSGDKAACRAKVKAAGVPVVPGSEGLIKNAGEAMTIAKQIGFPVLVKAAAGGGGKGMRIAHNDVALQKAVSMAAMEAQSAFGDDGVYIEKFLENARHVEIQVLADEHGRIVTLGERECTIQRRHQKLIEESPSMRLTNSMRAKMSKAAYRAAKTIGYSNAGTAEFLVAQDGTFYFIEFNARIQVEHPVTEMITNIDLVKEQIRIAAANPRVTSPRFQGHAIEARVYAEPRRQFRAQPGAIAKCHPRRTGNPRRQPYLSRLHRFRAIMLAAGESHRVRQRPRRNSTGLRARCRSSRYGVKTTAQLCANFAQRPVPARRSVAGPNRSVRYETGKSPARAVEGCGDAHRSTHVSLFDLPCSSRRARRPPHIHLAHGSSTCTQNRRELDALPARSARRDCPGLFTLRRSTGFSARAAAFRLPVPLERSRFRRSVRDVLRKTIAKLPMVGASP